MTVPISAPDAAEEATSELVVAMDHIADAIEHLDEHHYGKALHTIATAMDNLAAARRYITTPQDKPEKPEAQRAQGAALNRIDAPWTDDQVASLNDYQQCGHCHPFTGADRVAGEPVVLIATRAGWIEREDGPVVQTWAWDFMTDGSWRQAVR